MIKKVNGDKVDYITRNSSLVFSSRFIKSSLCNIVSVYYPSAKYYSKDSVGIIDTGACNSIITSSALFRLLSETQYNILYNALTKTDVYTHIFSSVVGSSDVVGYLCILPEILLNGFRIKKFPFYLIFSNYKKILIGLDFISSCDTVQLKNNCFEFYNFDISSMRLKMHNQKAFNLSNLSKL